MPIQQSAHRYQEVEIKTASPIELVVMLYDAATAGLHKAQEQFAARDIAGRARSLNKVLSILTELQANLNFEKGGDIAPSLDRLYHYMKNSVLQANLQQDAAPLNEILTLLNTLREAWAEAAKSEAQNETGRTAAAPDARRAPAVSISASGPAAPMLANLNVTA